MNCPHCNEPMINFDFVDDSYLYRCPKCTREYADWEVKQLPTYGDFYYGRLLECFIALDRQIETLTRLDIARVRNYEAQGFWLFKSEDLEVLPPLTALHSITDGGVLYALMQTVGRGEWVE